MHLEPSRLVGLPVPAAVAMAWVDPGVAKDLRGRVWANPARGSVPVLVCYRVSQVSPQVRLVRAVAIRVRVAAFPVAVAAFPVRVAVSFRVRPGVGPVQQLCLRKRL